MSEQLPPTGLDVDEATVRFGETLAVDAASVRVPTGEVLAVLGPSGCGKSTLLRAVAGLEPVSSGTVRYDGRDLDGVPTHRRGFALMFQDGQLFGHLDVAANVAYPLRLRRTDRAGARRRVVELLELVGLGGYAERAPASLSGGERQRVALARALAVEPRLLLLDEPLSALDRGLRERLAADLRAILKETGTTALLVTHDQEEAFAIADAMALMRAGRIIQHGTLAQVWGAPVDDWAARFLGYASVLSPAAARRLLGTVTVAGSTAGTGLALRRSALRVDPDGPIQARVRAARLTPEQIRITVTVEGVGELEAVADPDADVPVGAAVRLVLDAARTAPVPPAPEMTEPSL